MKNVVVVGAQWGDEGKGRVVDWLAGSANAVIRFNGGHNAGHTIVAGGETFKLSILPSGIIRGTCCVIGSGVVIDPWHLLSEIAQLKAAGINVSRDNLLIDSAATLILPFHREIERHAERNTFDVPGIGTTQRGIGPAYEDRVGRRAIRVADLLDAGSLIRQVDRALSHHNLIRGALGQTQVDRETLVSDLLQVAESIGPHIRSGSQIRSALGSSDRLIFEGAQGVLLDIDMGTYPYVTSSYCCAPYAALGGNYGGRDQAFVLGVAKAYTTRVGRGPFPTGDDEEASSHLQRVGSEVGVNTGRLRSCGWLDIVALRHAVTASRIDGLVLTKLDVLDGLGEIKICDGYALDGEDIDYFPQQTSELERVVPIYKTFPGWDRPSFGARTPADLPDNALFLIENIERLAGVSVVAVSCSPERDELVVLKPLIGGRQLNAA